MWSAEPWTSGAARRILPTCRCCGPRRWPARKRPFASGLEELRTRRGRRRRGQAGDQLGEQPIQRRLLGARQVVEYGAFVRYMGADSFVDQRAALPREGDQGAAAIARMRPPLNETSLLQAIDTIGHAAR